MCLNIIKKKLGDNSNSVISDKNLVKYTQLMRYHNGVKQDCGYRFVHDVNRGKMSTPSILSPTLIQICICQGGHGHVNW